MIIGSLGPWATATVFGISVSVSGLHGGGWVTLITAIVGAIVVLDLTSEPHTAEPECRRVLVVRYEPRSGCAAWER
jgi:hypothetical protein